MQEGPEDWGEDKLVNPPRRGRERGRGREGGGGGRGRRRKGQGEGWREGEREREREDQPGRPTCRGKGEVGGEEE